MKNIVYILLLISINLFSQTKVGIDQETGRQILFDRWGHFNGGFSVNGETIDSVKVDGNTLVFYSSGDRYSARDLNSDYTTILNFKKYLTDNNDNYYDAMIDIIAALPDSNAIIYIPAGEYNMTCPILLDSALLGARTLKNITIMGDGRDATFLRVGTNITNSTTPQNFDSDVSTILHLDDNSVFSAGDGIAFGTGMVAIVDTVYTGDSLNVEIHYMTPAAGMHPFTAGSTRATHIFPAIFVSDSCVTNLTIKDLSVVGSKQQAVVGAGNELEFSIWLNNLDNVWVHHVGCFYGRDDAIFFNDCNNLKVSDNMVNDYTDNGIHFSGTSKLVQILDNWIKDATEGIFFCLHGDSVIVTNNTIIGGEKAISGISSEESHIFITTNMISSPSNIGIEILNGDGMNAVKANMIIGGDVTSYGIYMVSTLSTTVRNNSIYQCDTAIWLSNVRNCIFSQNDMVHCDGVGIHLDEDALAYPSDNDIVGNSFFNVGKHIYSENTSYIDSVNYFGFENRIEDSGTNRLVIYKPNVLSTSFDDKGRMWWDSATNKTYIWDGSAWQALW